MTASELKARTETVLKDKKTKLPKRVEDALNRAASEGAYYCHYYDWIEPVHVEALKENGFEVTSHSYYEGTYFKISWK